MARRGVQISERPPVPVHTSEPSKRNEERFRAQVIDMLRERDRAIADIQQRQELIVKRLDDLVARVEALEAP